MYIVFADFYKRNQNNGGLLSYVSAAKHYYNQQIHIIYIHQILNTYTATKGIQKAFFWVKLACICAQVHCVSLQRKLLGWHA